MKKDTQEMVDGMIKAGNDSKKKHPVFSHFCLKRGAAVLDVKKD